MHCTIHTEQAEMLFIWDLTWVSEGGARKVGGCPDTRQIYFILGGYLSASVAFCSLAMRTSTGRKVWKRGKFIACPDNPLTYSN